MRKLSIFFALNFLAVFSSNALVDYSPTSSVRKSNSPKIDITNLQTQTRKSSRVSVRRKNAMAQMFFFSTGFNSISGENSKYDQYGLGVTLMTPWKIYFDLDLNYGGISEEGSTYSLGNTEFSVGATWLEFGAAYDMISIDVIGGMSLGVEDSDMASRRDDSYVGLLTKKNFGVVDLSLGFEYWFMDDDKYEGEISPNGFNKYLVNAGWTVSSDIRFDLSVQFINLSDIEGADDISYTEVSPQVGLKIGRGLHLNLGGRFSSDKKVGANTLSQLKVWNISSLYGNSYFTKLSFQF